MEMPNLTTGLCTHQSDYNNERLTVYNCKSRTQPTCLENPKCHFNFDELPSDKPGACTHKLEYR